MITFTRGLGGRSSRYSERILRDGGGLVYSGERVTVCRSGYRERCSRVVGVRGRGVAE